MTTLVIGPGLHVTVDSVVLTAPPGVALSTVHDAGSNTLSVIRLPAAPAAHSTNLLSWQTMAALLPFRSLVVNGSQVIIERGTRSSERAIFDPVRLQIRVAASSTLIIRQNHLCQSLVVHMCDDTALMCGLPTMTRCNYLDLRNAPTGEVRDFVVERRLQLSEQRDPQLRLRLRLEHDTELSGDVGHGTGIDRVPAPRYEMTATTFILPLSGGPGDAAQLMQALMALVSLPPAADFQAVISDANHPFPEQRLASVASGHAERLQKLAQLRGGSVLAQDLDFRAFLDDQHPLLLSRVDEQSLANAIARHSAQLSEVYALQPMLTPPESAGLPLCVICQEIYAAMSVCTQCRRAVYCEQCFSRQLLLGKCECALCRAALTEGVVWLL